MLEVKFRAVVFYRTHLCASERKKDRDYEHDKQNYYNNFDKNNEDRIF